MNKQDLIDAVAASTGESKTTVANVLDAVTAATHEALGKGEEVSLHGIGKLAVKLRKGRTGRNPRTGETIEIAAKNSVAFTAFKPLKDAVNA